MFFVLNFNKKRVADVRFLRKKYANSDFLCKFAVEWCFVQCTMHNFNPLPLRGLPLRQGENMRVA